MWYRLTVIATTVLAGCNVYESHSQVDSQVDTLLRSEAARLSPGEHSRIIDVGGRERSYLAYVPSSYQRGQSMPLVLAYHGGATDAETMCRFSGLDEKAEAAGFIGVYPNGTGRRERVLTFNAGNCCGYAMRNNVDDVQFTRDLLDDLSAVVSVDQRRVYATGMSNGAMMCYRLAAEMAEKIAAIAPVSGPM